MNETDELALRVAKDFTADVSNYPMLVEYARRLRETWGKQEPAGAVNGWRNSPADRTIDWFKNFGGDSVDEARCRKLCSMYLTEFVQNRRAYRNLTNESAVEQAGEMSSSQDGDAPTFVPAAATQNDILREMAIREEDEEKAAATDEALRLEAVGTAEDRRKARLRGSY